ncbi:putative LRR receptor-like serine/threonine-protein kinase At1g53430 [Bidens hawaiensis]|uniref:putative LRR receptor-like serine/threonine-protein kinase At1g53430 n=1 Tax=Bidens hawaiensis TaxID=980011 RepID=UPI00404B6287
MEKLVFFTFSLAALYGAVTQSAKFDTQELDALNNIGGKLGLAPVKTEWSLNVCKASNIIVIALSRGELPDGTLIAVKKLAEHSKQGIGEFVTELTMLSRLQHRNLVKLHGCCVEENQLSLIYEYMENNSLKTALLKDKNLTWPMRFNICVGIASGLGYLHLNRTIHRDVKPDNILLDGDHNPKIADLGMAKLRTKEDIDSIIETRVVGTFGYLDPEYVKTASMNEKSDARSLQRSGRLLQLVDSALGREFASDEVSNVLNVALLCANDRRYKRPTKSQVLSMLKGEASYRAFKWFNYPLNDAETSSTRTNENTRSTNYGDYRDISESREPLNEMDSSLTCSSVTESHDST